MFDAVGTLIDPNQTVGAVYHAVGRRFGSQFTIDEVRQRFRHAFQTSESDGFPGGPSAANAWKTSDAIEEARWRWIVGTVLSDATDREACFRELWDHFARPGSWTCFDDVEPALERLLGAGYRLAVASNFDSRLNPVCDALNPLKAIQRRIVSASIGIRKPALEFYSAVIKACACAPQQILMVGDSLNHDVIAPRAAGLKALHLDRGRTGGQADSLSSLLDLVARLLG
jgi:putative hydrolase of the HAD superfamily